MNLTPTQQATEAAPNGAASHIPGEEPMSDERKPLALTEWQIDFLQHAMKITGEQIERMAEVLATAGVIPRSLPADPRERALYLRKNRNTGPGKPIQEQRRKR